MTRITACAALFLFMCGEEQPAAVTVVEVASDGPTETSAAPTVAGVTHGGTIVDVGPHPIEVVVADDGAIDAYPVAGSPPPPAQSLATVRVPADDGETHPVMLIWDPSHGAFRGRLRGAQPRPGPIEITVTTSGETHRGHAPRFVVVEAGTPHPVTVATEAPPSSGAAAIVVTDGPPAPQVVVERPESHIVVAPRPARPHITVERPSPRPHIVLGHGAHLSPRHGLELGHGRGHGRGHERRGHGRRHGRRH